MINHRFDEFQQSSLAKLITAEPFKVPAASPYYVKLREIPRQDVPSTILVRNSAASSSVNPDQDCSIYQNTPSVNDNGTRFYVGRDFIATSGGMLWRSFLRFDISALPTSPDSVKLRLYCGEGPPSVPFSVHNVTSSWTETGPTWTSQPTYNTSPASAFSTVPRGPKDPANGWYECDITNLYNTWKSGTNNGLLIKSDEATYGTVTYFDTRSGPNPPQLVVVSAGNVYAELGSPYVDPGPGEFACHYGTGRLAFHSSAADLDLVVDYRGTGSAVDAQDMPVWVGETTGTNTYVANTETDVALVPGLIVVAKVGNGNTGASTLNVNGTGAKPILKDAAPLGSGVLIANAVYQFCLDEAGNFHKL